MRWLAVLGLWLLGATLAWSHPRLEGLPDNTALNLGSYVTSCRARMGQPGSGFENCASITDMAGFTYNPYHRTIHMFGGGHAGTMRDDVDTFRFDTLEWASDYPPTPCAAMTIPGNYAKPTGTWTSSGNPVARHTYDGLIMVPVPHPTMVMMYRKVILQGINCVTSAPAPLTSQFQDSPFSRYNPVAKTWSFDMAPTYPPAGSQNLPDLAAWEYDPMSRRIIGVNQYGLWSYDLEQQKLTKHVSQTDGAKSYAQNLVYNPQNRKHYYVHNWGQVWEVTLDRVSWNQSTMIALAVTGDRPQATETGWAWDSANAVIGGGITGGHFFAFDPETRVWTNTVMQVAEGGGAVGSVIFHALAYDPQDNVYVFLSAHPTSLQADKTWAYKYRTPPPALVIPVPVAAVTFTIE